MSVYFNLEKIYLFLLIALAFFLPLTVFGANLVIVIICVMWLTTGNYKSKFNQITNNKFILASIVFFCIHLLGLIWTEDFSWGLHIVHKMWYSIGLLPILFTIVKKDHIRYYISAFLLSISISEIASYLIWFELDEPFKNGSVENPTPFMSHISYNPILAFAIYLVAHELFFNKKLSNVVFSFYSFFVVSMTINMFITGGRAGQVAFFVVLAVLILQFFEKQRLKPILTILIVIPGIFFTSYFTSDLFQKRVNQVYYEIAYLSDNPTIDSSVGLRINYAINSLQIIKENPIIGVGTGDFPNEYLKIHQVKSPGLTSTSNPHNMYILVLVQLGLLGLASMLAIFYYQIKYSYNSSNKFIRDVGLTLPLVFLVVMLSDSYLLGHYTTLMYVFFSSFLYKDFEKP